ncbi:glycosyltransferase family 2 protein [Parablautia intestinalis]|uniref:glycosyltransferase family 2 protein n=1 Tax=Parablautia intestinalis TaxID=2320100 RepID=UPI00256EC906|nr:glycosyltransferase family 2 protein [Parablautia intestinalis]
MPILYLVVPCYNEEEIIEWSAKNLLEKINELIERHLISNESKIIFVNDGSRDKTFEILAKLCKDEIKFILINFTRNFGHQNAILAGMLFSKDFSDAVITIDADLQQDINAIELFVLCYLKGCDVVYGVRNSRETDGLFKRASANMFYWLMHLLGCDVVANSADYRLMSKRALQTLAEYNETNLFLRGLIPLMGFQSDIVYFDVKPRKGGKSKYSLKKMITLAIDGITSLSIKPIRFVTALGMCMCVFAIFMIIFSLCTWIIKGAVPGYTTTVISTWLVGGAILLSEGIIGEYIGKMYFETKKRPRFIIESIIQVESSKK